MVLSAYGRRRKEEMEKLEGRTHQMQGEDDKDWIQRMCAINAQRCRDDPRHHEMADAWQRDRDLRNAQKEERELIRQQQNAAHEKHLERERIRQRRSKALKEGKLEYYKECGKPYSIEWLRAEVVPHLPDYRNGAFATGTGTTAIREGLEHMRRLVGNGRPVRDKTAFVSKYARMMHEGRFTHFLDPATDHTREDLLVLEGDSPFDKQMVLDDAGAWVVARGAADVEWKPKIPNDEGWLPGSKPPMLERDKLGDIGKFDPNATPKPFVRLGDSKPVAQMMDASEPPPRKIVQPPLRHEAQKPPAAPPPTPQPQPPAEADPLLNGDPAVVRAYAGPPPSRAWCEQWLYKYLPEQRGVPLKARVSQKSYGKALIDTLALERPEWSLGYRRECFAFMLDKYDGMTEADVEREAQVLAEQQQDYAKKLSEAYGPSATRAPERRMREPGED